MNYATNLNEFRALT